MSKTKLFRETIKATLDFYKRKPWQGCLNGHAFALRLSGETHVWFGSVMGGGGEEFGLSLVRGPNGAAQQAAMLSHEPDERERGGMDLLGFSIDPLHEVPPEMRKHLEKARFPARRETLVPFFVVKEPGCHMRTINADEARIVLCIVNAILKTLKLGTFNPGMFGPGKEVLTLSIDTENPLDPAVKVNREIFEIPALGSDFTEPEVPEAVPDPDDLEAWKIVDTRVIGRLAKATGRLVNDKTMAEYFGSVDDAEDLLFEFGEHGAQACYIDWLAFAYRDKRRPGTVAQELAEADLPKADQMLLESRDAAIPTLCRVVSAGQGPVVQLEDIFAGESFEAHDHMMAEGVRRNKLYDMIVPVRYYAAGNFTFLAMVGPNFSDRHLPHILAFLEDEGLRPTDKGFENRSQLLGRLWLWLDDLHHAPMPKIQNTDDEPIEWHTASYALSEESEFRKEMLNRPDMEPEGDDDSDTFVWFREEANPKPGMGDRTLLGRIQLVGGEAVTEVNSSKRHQRLNDLLCRLPGVKFVALQRKDMQEMMEDRPLDDDLNPPEPVEMTPELVAAMNQHLEKYYMDWLDQPIPALDNKTPRQYCKTKSGKAKVTALIRGMGSPTMGGEAHGVEVPRQAMLRELGLE